MTTFEEAARRCEAAARAYRHAAKHGGDEPMRASWLQTVGKELEAAKDAERAALQSLSSLADATRRLKRPGGLTDKERILGILPMDSRKAVPVRVVRAALAEQGLTVDDSNVRKHLHELEAVDRIGAKQVGFKMSLRGRRLETCYWKKDQPPPPLASGPAAPTGGGAVPRSFQ